MNCIFLFFVSLSDPHCAAFPFPPRINVFISEVPCFNKKCARNFFMIGDVERFGSIHDKDQADVVPFFLNCIAFLAFLDSLPAPC